MVHTWKRVGRPISISFKMFELKNIYLLVCLKIHLHVYEVITFILEISEEKKF